MKKLLSVILALSMLMSVIILPASPVSAASGTIVLGNKTLSLGTNQSKYLNPGSITASGIYVYTTDFGASTPASALPTKSVVVSSDIVTYITDGAALIPVKYGYVVVFAGDKVNDAADIRVGDLAVNNAVDIKDYSTRSVVVKNRGLTIPLYGTNMTVDTAQIILYTDDYAGAEAGGNYAYSYVISKDGVITEKTALHGRVPVPEGGYVLTIHRNSNYQYTSVLSVGDEVFITPENDYYRTAKIEYNGENIPREENSIVLYSTGASTNTEKYGFELIFDKNNTLTGFSSVGDAAIPEGGFVLSGGDDASGINNSIFNKLHRAYIEGGKAVIDRANKTLYITAAPSLGYDEASKLYSEASALYDEMWNGFYELDFTKISSLRSDASLAMEELQAAVNSGDDVAAAEAAAKVKKLSLSMRSLLIESPAIEARGATTGCTETSDSAVETVIKNAVSLNINALYVEAHASGFFSGKSSIVPRFNGMSDYDPLEAYIRIGHKYGVEIHLMTTTFFAGTNASPTGISHILNKYPDAILLNKDGTNYTPTYYGNFYFANPYDPRVRSYLLSFYEEVLNKYDLDGVHLDYCRFPSSEAGYNADIIEGFQGKYNTSVNPKTLTEGDPLFEKWVDFRSETVTSFVEEFYKMAKEIRPHLWINAAVSFDLENSRCSRLQDTQEWVNRGIIDEVIPMSYCTSEDYTTAVAEKFESLVGDRVFVNNYFSTYIGTEPGEYIEQIRENRRAGSDGTGVFTLAYTKQNYETLLKSSAFAKKSAQPYQPLSVIGTGCSRLLDKIANIYKVRAAGGTGDYSEIEKILNSVIQTGEKYGAQGLTSETAKALCREAVSELRGIYTLVDSFTGDRATAGNRIIEDVDAMIGALDKTCLRIEAFDPSPSPEPEPTPAAGDVNGDGKVNIADAMTLFKYVSGMSDITLASESAAEVTGDGKINVADALKIYKYAAGLISAL